jgi:hypothetical protein
MFYAYSPLSPPGHGGESGMGCPTFPLHNPLYSLPCSCPHRICFRYSDGINYMRMGRWMMEIVRPREGCEGSFIPCLKKPLLDCFWLPSDLCCSFEILIGAGIWEFCLRYLFIPWLREEWWAGAVDLIIMCSSVFMSWCLLVPCLVFALALDWCVLRQLYIRLLVPNLMFWFCVSYFPFPGLRPRWLVRLGKEDEMTCDLYIWVALLFALLRFTFFIFQYHHPPFFALLARLFILHTLWCEMESTYIGTAAGVGTH